MKQKFYIFLLIIFTHFVARSQQATHLNFDGVDDFVNLGTTTSATLNSANNITLEAWIRPTVLNGWNNIVCDYNGTNMKYLLRVRNNNNIQFWINGVTLNSSFTVPLNTWTHIAAVWNGSTMYVYANGAQIATQAYSGSFSVSSYQTNIGARVGGTEYFTGSIDDVRIWNTARTIEQINGSKNCELQGTESGLIAYYKFNQGTDQANNAAVTTLNATTGPNGTLTNFTLNGATSNWLAGSTVTTGSIVPSVASVTSPVVYSQGATASALTATTGTNGSGLMWYTTATGGTGSATAPTPSTATLGSTNYWVASTNANGCESPRTQITVTVSLPATHLNFDGNNDFVSIPYNSNFNFGTSNFTVECWVKTTSTGIRVAVGSIQSGDFWLGVNNGKATFSVSGGGNATSTTTITNGLWHHITGVRNNGVSYIFVDGILENSVNNAVPFNLSSNPITIGNFNNGFNFQGDIDDVRIWNVARTSEQIYGSKNCELLGTETGLIAYYKFNQGTDQANNATVTSLTATTGPNGTLTNLALNGVTSNWLAGSTVTTGSIIPSVASVTSPVVYSQGATASALTATTGTNGSGLMWYATATGGTGSATAPTPSTATAGTINYWVASTNAIGCESARVQITVNIVPTNDECVNAIALNVGPTSFNDFPLNVNLTGATNSGLPSTTCGNFQGGDLWYTVAVPASGNVIIETNGVGNYDTGFEVYSGNCGALSSVICDDNTGTNNYSYILLLGQTPGTVLKVRVWENFWANSNAQFQISAYEYVNPATQLNFDGVNDHVLIPAVAINNLPQGSIEAWIRPTASVLDNQTICAKQSDFENSYAIFSIGGDTAANGKLFYKSKNGSSIVSTSSIVANQWTHVAVTFTGTQAQIYINGVLDATASGDFSLPNDLTVTATSIGAWMGNGNGQYFKGDIDEFRVWNAVLTPADIINTMNCELQVTQTNIVTYYKFNQGFDYANNSTVTALTDSVGSSNGTLTNFALAGGSSNWKSGSVITSGNVCSVLNNVEFDTVNTFNVYPNPNNGFFTINSNEYFDIVIYDMVGKIIYTGKSVIGENKINMSNFNNGIYVMNLINGVGKLYNVKIIKN